MTKPRLSYFDFPGGRGEDCRLAFFIAGVDFDDDRIKGAEWPQHKPRAPFGALPVLTIEGKGSIGQSNAILGYIGRTNGLYPTDPWEAARHEAIMGAVEDFRHKLDPSLRTKDADERKALREAFVKDFLPTWANAVEAQIHGPFISGDALTVADLKVFVNMKWVTSGLLDHIPADSFAGWPKLTGLYAAVKAHPKVQEWYAKYPAGAP